MSNFETFGVATGGLPGTAPSVFVASTADSLGTITTAGYVTDLGSKVKANDVMLINYSDTSTFPLGEASTLGQFMVTVSAGVQSLVPFLSGPGVLTSSLATPDTNANLIGFDVTVGFAALATGGSVILQASSGAKQYKIRSLELEGFGTNFSGGGGDRLGEVTDNTSVYSIIPAATMQSLVNARWGVGAPLPNSATVANDTSTAAGANLVFKYTGGTTDYTAGSLRISGLMQRVA